MGELRADARLFGPGVDAHQPLRVLEIGAGTGLLFLLRWFWWRINAFSEIAAMVVSFAVALWFEFGTSGEWAS